MITRDIYINSTQVTPPIRIVYGTDNLPVQFCMKDVTLASGNTAKFYSLAPSENRYEQTGTINTTDQTITFTPEAGFFETGQNLLQCEITQSGKVIYSFVVDVLCGLNVMAEGTAAEAVNVKMWGERAEAAAETAEAIADNMGSAFPTAEISGSITDVGTFTDGADGIPMKSVIVSIEPIQAGSGDPSPTNVRAISGWSQCKIDIGSANLYDISDGYERWYFSSNAIRVSSNAYCVVVPCEPNTTYVIHKLRGSRFQVAYTKTVPAIGESYYGLVQNNTSSEISITTGADALYIVVYVYYSTEDSPSGITLQQMLESVLVCEGTTYPITLGQTVYGGYLDVTKGLFYPEGNLLTYDGGSGATYTQNGSNVISIVNAERYRVSQTIICDQFLGIAPGASSGLTANQCRLTSNFAIINFKFSSDKTVDEWKAELAENPIHVYKKFAEPQTPIQLTPTQIKTLYGQNNIWADSGDISVIYRADPALYVDGQVAPIRAMVASEETGTTASQAYTAGQYFILDGQFCKALTNIASGATFTLGTNYQVTTIAAELFSALNS